MFIWLPFVILTIELIVGIVSICITELSIFEKIGFILLALLSYVILVFILLIIMAVIRLVIYHSERIDYNTRRIIEILESSRFAKPNYTIIEPIKVPETKAQSEISNDEEETKPVVDDVLKNRIDELFEKKQISKTQYDEYINLLATILAKPELEKKELYYKLKRVLDTYK